MARMCICKSESGKMKSQKVLRFLLLYNVLETVYRVVQAGDGRTHAFVHVDGDLRYLIDGVSMEMQEFYREGDSSAVSFTDLNEENLNAYASPIAFHPPMLNFHLHPVGMPHMERVTVQNLSPDTSIHMLSISGNTLHTHCSFFQEKVIPPGGNTSFDVVLLAREEGPVEDTLFIHTSLGSFKFQVSAVGIPNPYRLRPFVGIKMPLNSSYSPVIYMHNPHSTTIQLTEIYSSGGDLHLELPEGENDAPKTLWEIPPYETRPIIKANFIARIEKNHTAFIRIRTNCTGRNYLLLPVEVDVTSAPGIYTPIEMLDFGVLRSHDEPKTLTLSLLNSGLKHVHIMNVITTPVNEAVDVKFIPVKIAPDTVFSTQVATITFNPSRALHPKQCCGKIVIKSKNNQYKIQIPYQVNLIRGFLDYNQNSTRFYVGLQSFKSTRELNVINNFSVSIIIYNVSLSNEAKEHFIVKLNDPVVLKPGKSSTIAVLTFKPTLPDVQLTSYLRLHTNISHFDIPLLCFTGRLRVFLPHAANESFIDFGTLGMGDKRTIIFAVINENPVDVNLKFWGSNSSKTYVELVGVDKGNASTLAWRQNFSSMARSLILKPHHYAIFRIGISAPNHEGVFSGQAFVETQFEKINVPFNYRTAKGILKVDEIYLENSFPGKISTQSLYVHSTFSHSMTITGISTVPEDSRFTFDPLKSGNPVLHPNSKTMIGKIHFDHRKYCKQKCYSGLPTTTSMGHQWLLGMALPQDVAETDSELFKTLCKRWQSLLDLEEKTINISLRVDTTEVRGYLLKAQASLHWPRMFTKYKMKFPITQIGNHSVKDFTLENPSSLPVLVQVVPLSLYPEPAVISSILSERYGYEFGSNNIEDPDIFTLEDLEENNPNPDNHIPAYRKSLEEFFGIESHKKSIAMLLTPGMRVRIQVGFTPKDDFLRSSLILIRNNLTVMDALLVHGQGGYGEIKFGNIAPGSNSVLMFELTEQHLKDCDVTKSKYAAPNFTVRRTFTARNTGALPIYVKGFDINGKLCQGYGFRILNCQSLELQPNASKKIDIAYTPDFSLTHIERTLNIHTNQGPGGQVLQFKVVATVPRHMLSFCSKALTRPYWEQYLYLGFTALSVIMMFTAIVCGYLDSKHILHNTFFPFVTIGMHNEKIEKENLFDLNAICASANDNNSYEKQTVIADDVRKKNDNVPGLLLPENNAIINPIKNSVTMSKRKESSNIREFEENFNDCSKSKKKNSKLKQMQENYGLESNLIEIKKSQSRNSWTRFLKPPFSFHSVSNVNNKPSVATQTTPDSPDEDSQKCLKQLEFINDQNINCFLNLENNTRCKAKYKNENVFSDSKSIKKINDISPEEETSSTTTETSTTESDISEKDHQLCARSNSSSIFNKNKSRNHNLSSNSRSSSKKVETTGDAKGFELSTKSKSHKKVKVDPAKVFNGNILQPSSLELPYKPKASVDGERNEALEMFHSDNILSSINSCNVKDETYNDINEQNQGFNLPQGMHNHPLIKPSDSENPQFSLESFSKHPTYSAAVIKDNYSNIGKPDLSYYGIDKNGSDSMKTHNSSKSKRPHNNNFLSKKSNKPCIYSPDCYGSPEDNSLMGSKLRNWMVHSKNDSSSNIEQSSLSKEEDIHNLNSQCKPDSLLSNKSVWGNSFQSTLEQSGNLEEAQRKYRNWPGFDLTPVRESFWDPNYNPSGDSWADKPFNVGSTPNLSPNNFWRSSVSPPLESVSWSSHSSEGRTSVDSTTRENLLDYENKDSGEFDPFHTPSALWVSQLKKVKENFPGSSDPNTWSFSLFSDPSQVLFSENSQYSEEIETKVENTNSNTST